MRLLTIHNLAYLQRLMAELRDAIDDGPPRRGRRRGPRRRRAVGAGSVDELQGLRGAPAGAPGPAPTTR